MIAAHFGRSFIIADSLVVPHTLTSSSTSIRITVNGYTELLASIALAHLVLNHSIQP
jgi:hypothetical protein